MVKRIIGLLAIIVVFPGCPCVKNEHYIKTINTGYKFTKKTKNILKNRLSQDVYSIIVSFDSDCCYEKSSIRRKYEESKIYLNTTDEKIIIENADNCSFLSRPKSIELR